MNKFKQLHSKIKLLFKKKRRRVIHDEQLMHPEREWTLGLVIALILFFAAAVLSTYLYIQNQAVEVSVDGNKNDNTVYRESLVKEALEGIKQKEEKYSGLTTGSTPAPTQEEPAASEESVASTTPEVLEEVSNETTLPTLGD